MNINHRGTYAQARALCDRKRFATKGRLLDNYTAIVLRKRGEPDERMLDETKLCQTIEALHRRYYNSRRRDILIAAGARLAA